MPVISKQNKNQAKKKGKTHYNKSAWDRIQDIEFSSEDGIKICLYGRSGTGKTTTWASFKKPILSIVTSGGRKPGELRSVDTPENKGKIQTVTLRDPEEIFEVCEKQQITGRFNTIVSDHVTGLQDLVLAKILGLDRVPEQKDWGIASQGDWGQCTQQTMEVMKHLLSLDCNVVMIGHEREFNTDTESDLITPYVGPALTPKLAGWLLGACDYVCQTYIGQRMKEKVVKIGGGKMVTKQIPIRGKIDHYLRVGKDSVYMTKFRIPLGRELPSSIVLPDGKNPKVTAYGEIMKLIKGA